MADLTVTAANVLQGTGTIIQGTAGAAITAGQIVYLDTATNTYKLALSDSAAHAAAAGVAVNNAASGQYVNIQTTGTYTAGATVAIGKIYVVSNAAGGVRPVDDIAGGEYVTFFGIGTTAAIIQMADNPRSGVAAAGAVT